MLNIILQAVGGIVTGLVIIYLGVITLNYFADIYVGNRYARWNWNPLN